MMEDIYKFTISSDEFDRIESGKKTIHLVVNDPKRKVYTNGNQIDFFRKLDGLDEETLKLVEEGKTKSQIKAEIVNLLYFGDVREAVETLGKENCGFRPSETFEKSSDIFLSGESFEAIEKYGIVAIVFKTIE